MNEKPSSSNILTRNWGLKIASVLLAAILWFIVTNYNDPMITVPFYNIPVTLRNTNLITDQGQIYEILDGTDTVATVSITAPRSIAETFTRDNIIATADMQELTSRNTVPIHLSVNKNQRDNPVISGSSEDVRLNIENRTTRTIALTVTTSGQLAEGYLVGNVTPAQNLVRITGAESRVNKVAVASADVDVTGFTSDIQTESDVRLYDAEGVLIRDAGITQNITTVRVSATILQAKEVPLQLQPQGHPAEGFVLTGDNTVTPQSFMLAGDATLIGTLNEIVLSGDAFDLTGLTETLHTTVNLRDYLPAGVRFAETGANGELQVTVGIAPLVTREHEIPAAQIALTNQPEGATYRLAEEGPFRVTLTGQEADLNALDPATLVFALDVSSLIEEGAQPPAQLTGTAVVQLPNGVTMQTPLQLQLILEETE
ncbi:MAG: hypothetical protein IJR00_10410 [Lachnospiraceae bacterium]|nr:hypothetical protein [Lachnospiraceae bacterium]